MERVVHVEDVSESLGARPWSPLDETAAVRLEVADGVRMARDDGGNRAVLPRDRSRLGDGLRAADAALGAEPGAVRLRTDGRDTEGDAEHAARELAASGHRVYVEPPWPAPADVALDAVRVVAAGTSAPVEVAVTLSASVEGRVRASLFRDGAERSARTVDVSPLLPLTVHLVDAAPRRTSDSYEVRLVPDEGTPNDDRSNDRVSFVVATDVARIVIVGEGTAGPLFEDGLRTTRVSTLSDVELDAVDLLVASNVPYRALDDAGVERIARFVAMGGSMLVLGGPDAYGRGGVAGTAYERLLALRPRRDEGDGLACVVAFDRSGSTGESTGSVPAAIADLRRAIRALDRRLPLRTQLSVLPFSDRPDALIAVAERPVAARTDVPDGRLTFLDAILPAGGTDLALAIESAADAAAATRDVRRRRVFLLTDGDPDHPLRPDAFAPLRAHLDQRGVEFSAIVRGDEAAATALRALAARAEDVVRIEQSSEFPEALVRTFERGSARDEIETGPFTPVPVDEGADARAAALPRLSSLHRLDPAPDAVVWARAPSSDGASLPVAALLRVGAGRVVSFAGGPALEKAADRSAMLVALQPLFARLARAADRGLAAEREGDRLRVEGIVGLGSLPLFVNDEAVPDPLIETTNGLYEGALPPGTPIGALLRAGSPPRALRLPYAPQLEHRGAGVDASTLRAIAQAGGGRVLARGEPTPRRRGSTRVDLSPYCFAMAVLLLLFDRLVHRPHDRARGSSKRSIGGAS